MLDTYFTLPKIFLPLLSIGSWRVFFKSYFDSCENLSPASLVTLLRVSARIVSYGLRLAPELLLN